MKKSSVFLMLVVLVLLTGGYFIYTSQEQSKIIKTEIIISTGDRGIDNMITTLKKSMQDYMKETNPSYSINDINESASILSDYTKSIYKTKSKEEGMEIVKSTIFKLNALNDRCKGNLIETNEREKIAEIIILASHKMKYNSLNEDITEEWREW